MKDEFFIKYLVKNNLILPIINLLKSTKDRYNLVNSACLELFNFIEKENIKSLISHVSTSFKSDIDEFKFTDVFKKIAHKNSQNISSLKLVSEELEQQNKKQVSLKKVPPKGGIRVWSTRVYDDEEEAYFDDSDDEEAEDHSSLESEVVMDVKVENGPTVVIKLAESPKKSKLEDFKSEGFGGNSKSSQLTEDSTVPDRESHIPIKDNDENAGDSELVVSPKFGKLVTEITHEDSSADSESNSDEDVQTSKFKPHVDTPTISRGLSFVDRAYDLQNQCNGTSDNSPTPSPLSSPTIPRDIADVDMDDKLESMLSKSNKRNLSKSFDSDVHLSDKDLTENNLKSSGLDVDESENGGLESLAKRSKSDPYSPKASVRRENSPFGGSESGANETISFSFKKRMTSPKRLIFDFKSTNKNPKAKAPIKLARSNSGSVVAEIPGLVVAHSSEEADQDVFLENGVEEAEHSKESTELLRNNSPGSDRHSVSFGLSPKTIRKNLSFTNS
ncbi:Serine/threonine-protein phosphatase 4 regulatory subunit 3-A [Smittium mucronatum]|uniref:Serine/threonine-protein phosphatase 4 regulatory subunit 3-A n=1 Tax=Smittium mucronatum TaxID=133383 RepID=A0A1R0GSV5_9FUNG|nr:Serine/threonine-protein phosphatase 4 regulatory subunit 3-A [Smittium mucronatum]